MITKRDRHVIAKRPESGICIDFVGDSKQLLVFESIRKPFIFHIHRRWAINFEGDESIAVHSYGCRTDGAVILVSDILPRLKSWGSTVTDRAHDGEVPHSCVVGL